MVLSRFFHMPRGHVAPREPKSEADQFLEYVAQELGGPGSTVSDPERLKGFLVETTKQYEAEKQGNPAPSYMPGYSPEERGGVERPRTAQTDWNTGQTLVPREEPPSLMRPLITPEMVERVPTPLRPIASGVREMSSPVMIGTTIGTAGLGPAIAGGIRGGTGAIGAARGIAAGAAAPVLEKAPFAARLAGETAIGVAANAAPQYLPEDAPTALKVATGIGAGVVTGMGASRIAAPQQVLRGMVNGQEVRVPVGKVRASPEEIEELKRLSQRADELEAEISGTEDAFRTIRETRSPVMRTRGWMRGHSDEELFALAKQEGIPESELYSNDDWADSIDKFVIRDFKNGDFKITERSKAGRTRSAGNQLNSLMKEQEHIKARMDEILGAVEPEEAPAGQGVQSSMGIGERPPQGALFDTAKKQGDVAPTAADDVLRNEQAKAAARSLVKQGQQQIKVPEQPVAPVDRPGGLAEMQAAEDARRAAILKRTQALPDKPISQPPREPPPAAASAQGPTARARPAAPVTRRLPPTLRGAKPRYKEKKLAWSSDVDLALYTVGTSRTTSRRHELYVDWLKEQFGDDVDLNAAGQRVVQRVRQGAENSVGDTYRVPDTGITPRVSAPVPQFEQGPGFAAGPLARNVQLPAPVGQKVLPTSGQPVPSAGPVVTQGTLTKGLQASGAKVPSAGPVPVQGAFAKVPNPAGGPPAPPKGPPPTTTGMPGQPTGGSGKPTPLNVLNKQARGQAALSPRDRARVSDQSRPLTTKTTDMPYVMEPYRTGVQKLNVNRPDLAKTKDPVRNIAIRANTWEARDHSAIDAAAQGFRKEFNDAFGWKRDPLRPDADWISPLVVMKPGNPSLHPRTIYDIVENPSQYQLSASQKTALQKGIDTMTRALRDAQAQGVDSMEIADARWHRIVTGGVDVSGSPLPPAQLPSGRRGSLQARRYDTAEEGWANGERYATDPFILFTDDLKAKVTAVKWASVKDDLKGVPGVQRVAARIDPAIQKEVTDALSARQQAINNLNVAGGNRPVKVAALQAAETRYVRAMQVLADARSKAVLPRLGEGQLTSGINAPKKILDSIEKYLQPSAGDKTMETVADIGRLVQTFQTTADLSYSFVQGQALFYRNNPAWWKSQAIALSSVLKDPAKYYEANRALIQRGARLGAINPPSEFIIQKAGIASLPGKIPAVGAGLRGVNRVFSTFITVGQAELFRAAEIAVAKSGSKAPMQELASMSTAIRKIMGNTPMEELGLSQRRQLMERIALFAPRFFRATTGLVTQSFTKGPGGNEARKAMGSLMAGGLGLTIGIHYAFNGDMPNLTDPDKSDYLKFRAGDTWYSAFGPFHPIFVTLGRATQDVKQGNYKDAVEDIRRFIRNKSGPVISLGEHAMQFLLKGESETFEGEPIPASPSGALKLVSEYAPIGPSEVVQGGVQALPELTGVNTTPLSTQNVRDDAAKAQGTDYDNMRYLDKVKLNQTPEIRERVVQSALDRPDSYSGKKLIAEADYYQREVDLMERFFKNTLYPKTAEGKATTPAQQRARLVDEYYTLQAERRGELGQIREEFPSDYEADKLGATGPEDTALQEYFDILDQSVNQVGNFDSVVYKKLKAEKMKTWTAAQKAYVEEYRKTKEHPPVLWALTGDWEAGTTLQASGFARARADWERLKKTDLRQDLMEIAAQTDLPIAVGQ